MTLPLHSTLPFVPLLFFLAACAEPETGEAGAEETVSTLSASIIQVDGFDYRFEAPEVIDAGWTTFRFANHGPEAHHLTLMRLKPGRTSNEVLEALSTRQPLTDIATSIGGPNAPMPGASTDATLDLEAGEYVLICLIPSPDGLPHFLKGMVKPITVRERLAEAEVQAPAADLEVALNDYSFEVKGAVASGPRSIRVTNAASATEPHEIALVRLPPGTSAEAVNDWMHAMEGPPPAEFIGGITALDPGESGLFSAEFTPGEYAFLCPLPSPDGVAHTYKGMIHQFTVM